MCVRERVPPGGRCKAAAGTVAWKWVCKCCNALATNSSKLLELLRTPCGDGEGSWEQQVHATQLQGLRVECVRCGTSWQRYVHLAAQKCPVRRRMQAGAEVQAGTAIYAAWYRTIRAMHRFGSVQRQQTVGDAVAAEPAEIVIDEAPVRALLRPFRAHRIARTADVEFCLRCFAKAPRFRVADWRAGCCDGDVPIGSCPKHILATVYLTGLGAEVPQARQDRYQALRVAARVWQHSVAAKFLRPPKRRVGTRQPPPLDPAARIRSRL